LCAHEVCVHQLNGSDTGSPGGVSHGLARYPALWRTGRIHLMFPMPAEVADPLPVIHVPRPAGGLLPKFPYSPACLQPALHVWPSHVRSASIVPPGLLHSFPSPPTHTSRLCLHCPAHQPSPPPTHTSSNHQLPLRCRPGTAPGSPACPPSTPCLVASVLPLAEVHSPVAPARRGF